jgi:hypothetical protein
MLEKDPALRPGAIEVRQIARAIALELSPPYEEFEISGQDVDKRITPARGVRAPYLAAEDAFVADADSLEHGQTEMLPVVPRPRWTPEIGRVPSSFAAGRNRQAIAPKSPRDQVAGEILMSHKHR